MREGPTTKLLRNPLLSGQIYEPALKAEKRRPDRKGKPSRYSIISSRKRMLQVGIMNTLRGQVSGRLKFSDNFNGMEVSWQKPGVSV